MEGLANKVGAGQTAVNPTGVSALFRYRRDAGMRLQIGGGGPAGAVGA